MTLHRCLLSPLLAASFTFGLTQEGLVGLPDLPSAHTLISGQVTLGFSGHGHSDGTLVRGKTFLAFPSLAEPPDTLQISDLQSYSASAQVVLGLFNHIDLGFSIPWEADFTTDTKAKELSGQGPGDPQVFLKLGLGGAEPGIFDIAALVKAHIGLNQKYGFLPSDPGFNPTQGINPQRLHSAGTTWGEGGLLATLDLRTLENPIPLAFHLGSTYRNLPKATLGAGLVTQGGVEWGLTPNMGVFLAAKSIARADSLKSGAGLFQEWATLSGGMAVRSTEGFSFDIGIHRGLAKTPWTEFQFPSGSSIYRYGAKTQPQWSLTVQFGWTLSAISPDGDQDGVINAIDMCKDAAEDNDNFQDSDGCPETDNDLDSVPDISDQCPLDKEDVDGYLDVDGCPDLDNDADGVPDLQDKCPQDGEDKDGTMDYDGCPDFDNDGDAILDSQDKCPSLAEDKDGFQDDDGCVDVDNDRDGITDVNDSCPNVIETVNNYLDLDGCPDTAQAATPEKPSLQRLAVLEQVRFQGITNNLSAESYPVLDSIAGLLRRSRDVVVLVKGYMDLSEGAKAAMSASKIRANKVRNYLILKGAKQSQVRAEGYGASRPIAPNNTAKGRMKNRRIELEVVEGL
jgi:outer membrane protein OmpA-like peptidoglycan-associated protein